MIAPTLARLDLLHRKLGRLNEGNEARVSYSRTDPKNNRTTRIRASDKLRRLFVEARFGRRDIGRATDEEIIILRNADGKQASYDDTPETNRMRDDLRAYNDLIAASFIDIRALEGPILSVRDDSGITRSIQLDDDAHRTRRIFSRGSWNLNGRFYGGWWLRRRWGSGPECGRRAGSSSSAPQSHWWCRSAFGPQAGSHGTG